MTKKHEPSQDDIEAFEKAMKGTRPLKTRKKTRLVAPSSRKPTKQKQSEPEDLKFSETLDIPSVQGEEIITYKQASISNKILRKLHKGQYNVGAILDLHGMKVEEARVAVENFLQQSLQAKIRVVLIIHGKGHHSQSPILKNKLNHWLREINIVLAFSSASRPHGSGGATYVLLKRLLSEI